MWPFVLEQLELLIRLVVAGICGCLIGFERKNRLKEAGIRTHMIVAVGAALIMIISKYGFADVLTGDNVRLDPSRIASQIVTGIGFLGAGMIFLRKQAISGLTTAAGVWATAGIGMAIGAQLYVIGISATVFVFFVQVILFKHYGWFRVPVTERLDIVINDGAGAIDYIRERLTESRIEIVNMKAERQKGGSLEVELYVKLPKGYDASDLMNLFKDNPHVKSIEY